MKKKVLFFVNSYAGGAERITINIADFMEPNLYDVVFYVVGQDLGLVERILPSRFTKKLIKVRSFKDFLIFKLIKILWIEKPDFVFSSLMPINWRLCFASVLYPKAKVIVRANNYLYTQSFIQKLRLFLAYRFANKVVVQTLEMKSEHVKVLRLNSKKVIDLANPLNTDAIDLKLESVQTPFMEGKINYTFAGRINYVKGIDILIKSFAKVVKIQESAMLYIVGENGGKFEVYYRDFIELVEAYDLVNKVVFTGFTDNPYRYMKFADCFVLPSRNEGLPNVVIESLYIGTPVAVTVSIPVVKRIVRNSIDGYLAEVDDIDSLAQAMLSAGKLGRVTSAYRAATKEDFLNLFT